MEYCSNASQFSLTFFNLLPEQTNSLAPSVEEGIDEPLPVTRNAMNSEQRSAAVSFQNQQREVGRSAANTLVPAGHYISSKAIHSSVARCSAGSSPRPDPFSIDNVPFGVVDNLSAAIRGRLTAPEQRCTATQTPSMQPLGHPTSKNCLSAIEVTEAHDDSLGIEVNGEGHGQKFTLDALRQLFHLPGRHAAEALGISYHHLKQISRRLGLIRWPHRKLESLKLLRASLDGTLKAECGVKDVELLKQDIDAELSHICLQPNAPVSPALKALCLTASKSGHNTRPADAVAPTAPAPAAGTPTGTGRTGSISSSHLEWQFYSDDGWQASSKHSSFGCANAMSVQWDQVWDSHISIDAPVPAKAHAAAAVSLSASGLAATSKALTPKKAAANAAAAARARSLDASQNPCSPTGRGTWLADSFLTTCDVLSGQQLEQCWSLQMPEEEQEAIGWLMEEPPQSSSGSFCCQPTRSTTAGAAAPAPATAAAGGSSHGQLCAQPPLLVQLEVQQLQHQIEHVLHHQPQQKQSQQLPESPGSPLMVQLQRQHLRQHLRQQERLHELGDQIEVEPGAWYLASPGSSMAFRGLFLSGDLPDPHEDPLTTM